MARDWRDDRIAKLEAELAERDRVIANLTAQVGALTAQVGALLRRVAELEEQLRKSLRNSSKPPSSDGPAVAPRPRKPSTGRKPGGQPGHERHERELVPPEKVRRVVECIPEHCDHCGAPLHGRDPGPHGHQVTHLPPVEPVTDEYRQHLLGCSQCGGSTVGKLPAGVPSGAFGPSVVAVVAVLMGAYRQSKRLAPELLYDLFHLRLSVGAAVGCQHIASAALEAPSSRRRSTSPSSRSNTRTKPGGARGRTGRGPGCGWWSPRPWLSSGSRLAETPTPPDCCSVSRSACS